MAWMEAAGSILGRLIRRTPRAFKVLMGMRGVVGRFRMPKPMLTVTGMPAACTMAAISCSE